MLKKHSVRIDEKRGKGKQTDIIKHSLQGTQDKENRTGRFVFISNSALKNKSMDISMAPIFHNWQTFE